MLIDFENIEEKCNAAADSAEYSSLVDKVNKAKKIFLIGNGGLHSTRQYIRLIVLDSSHQMRMITDIIKYLFVGWILLRL